MHKNNSSIFICLFIIVFVIGCTGCNIIYRHEREQENKINAIMLEKEALETEYQNRINELECKSNNLEKKITRNLQTSYEEIKNSVDKIEREISTIENQSIHSAIIPYNADSYIDSDVLSIKLFLLDTKSSIILKREPDAISYAVCSEGYIDFENQTIGFFKARSTNDNREILFEESLEFNPIQGHEYVILFQKDDALNIKLSISDSFTGKSKTITSTTVDVGEGWGKRSYEISKGNMIIEDFRDYSTQISNSHVAIIGDSFIEGNSIGLSKNERYAYLLKRELNGSVFINGQGGSKSIDGLNWLDDYILKIVSPQYMIIAFGMNENDYDTWINNMENIISRLESQNITPILVTITPTNSKQMDNATHMKMNEWIRNSNYHYIDAAKACSLNNDCLSFNEKFFLIDGIHPSITGHKAIFDQIKKDCPFLFE